MCIQDFENERLLERSTYGRYILLLDKFDLQTHDFRLLMSMDLKGSKDVTYGHASVIESLWKKYKVLRK
jgi:hypothetical protein